MNGAPPVRCYVALGSNLGDPDAQIASALDALDHLPDTRRVATSPVYASRPLGPADQPDFLNAVAALDTGLQPLDLLAGLQAIEREHGRVRGRRWDARTLDLDLLLYGNLQLDSDLLTLPHPGLSSRDFVLYPLADIAPPELPIPGLGRLDELLALCPRRHLKERP